VFPNAKTAGNGGILLIRAVFKEPNVSNATGRTKQNITENSVGVVRRMLKLILPDLKQKRANPALTHSSVQTAKENIKPTRPIVRSGSIASTENGTLRSMPRYVKTDLNPSTLPRTVVLNNDFEKPESIFSKRSQEFSHRQHYTRNPHSFRYNSNPRAALV